MKQVSTEPSGRLVLVVDDQAEVRSAVARLLRRLGYDVREAAGGSEAVRMVRRSPVDIVLTDLHMPGMDGLELIVALQAARPGTLVVAMSGDIGMQAGTLEDARLLGAVMTLAKPFTAQELGVVMAKALEVRRRDAG
jgi:two-component system, NtrC family, response regulator AtoC